MIKNLKVFFLLSVFFCLSKSGSCQGKYDFKRIEDNSFLIEEAYNQETGVIQHISAFQYFPGHKWLYTFTDEWPVGGQKNQLSATIPVLKNEATGLGDIALNYRYQAILRDRIAFSPRFSLFLPTGQFSKGLGSGVPGYQVDLPFSFIVSTKIVTHYNIGCTYIPNMKNDVGIKTNQTAFNYGFSTIILASENFNIMFEIADYQGNSNVLFINPGIRYAFNLPSGMQIVPGVALPIQTGPSGGAGLFLYFSIEHPLRKLNTEP